MSSNIISIRGGDYPFTRHIDGVYRGLEMRYEACGAEEAFATILENRSFEVCEFSLANFGMLSDRGDKRFYAIPVFANRAYRHGVVWTREGSTLEDFRDLLGKRVAVKEYSQTAAVWFRGLLLEEYGVDWRDINWFSNPMQRFLAPTEARVNFIEGDLEALVLEGKLDAYVSTRVSKPSLRPILREHRNAASLYGHKTGIFPINHTVLIARELIERYPQVAYAVFDAYRHSRRLSESVDVFGFTEVNRKNVETVFRYLQEQKLTRNLQKVDDLFLLKDATDDQP